MLQKQKRAAAVRRVVRNRNRSPVGNCLRVLQGLRIDRDRRDEDRHEALELQVVLLHEVVEIGLVLEEVRIERLVGKRHVGLDVVGEFNDLEFDPLLGELRLQEIHDVAARHRRDADGERLRCRSRLGRGRLVLPAASGEAEGNACRNAERGKRFELLEHTASSKSGRTRGR